jgi:hypothetical protein
MSCSPKLEILDNLFRYPGYLYFLHLQKRIIVYGQNIEQLMDLIEFMKIWELACMIGTE